MDQPTNISPANASLDHQDIAETYRTFRRARLILFCLLVIGLVVTQSLFWMVDGGAIDDILESGEAVFVEDCSDNKSAGSNHGFARHTVGPTAGEFRRVENESDNGLESAQTTNALIREGLLATNYVLFLSAILYGLMMLAGVYVALVGRLGGLAAAGKAFFLSLVALVLLMPWQLIVGTFPGTLYTYSELIERYRDRQEASSLADWDAIRYYVRFSGLWLVTMALLILAQLKSSKSKKQILQRLRPQPPGPEPMTAPMQPPQSTIPVSDSGDT